MDTHAVVTRGVDRASTELRMTKSSSDEARNRAIGLRITQAMKDAGIRPSELFRRLGLPNHTALWRYQAGKVECPLPKLELIANETGKTVDWLLGRTAVPGEDPQLEEAPPSAARAAALEISQLGLSVAKDASPEAIRAFNAAILEYVRAQQRKS